MDKKNLRPRIKESTKMQMTAERRISFRIILLTALSAVVVSTVQAQPEKLPKPVEKSMGVTLSISENKGTGHAVSS